MMLPKVRDQVEPALDLRRGAEVVRRVTLIVLHNGQELKGTYGKKIPMSSLRPLSPCCLFVEDRIFKVLQPRLLRQRG